MRLDRYLSHLPSFNRSQVRALIASGKVSVNQQAIYDGHYPVSVFDQITLDDQVLQSAKQAHYLMLHKPAGYVSATEHPEHPTVLDLVPPELSCELHLAGRLDLTTTGLLILTNDGQWSRRLTNPGSTLGKRYRVQTEQPISQDYKVLFAQGMYFAYEDLTTLPAHLEIISSHTAYLTLHEGRYHQVKRMFGHFQNKVIGLHREAMGAIELDPALAPGQWRTLTAQEIASV